MILSVLIATTEDRKQTFERLFKEFESQLDKNQLRDTVELVVECDNKEISIGAKRQKLLERAKGKWIVFFDDDDWPMPYYIAIITYAVTSDQNIDCVGINVKMTTNDLHPQKCCHSFKYPVWKDNVDGWDYVRNITHFNPVKKELALKAGFKDLRFGEDIDYSNRLYPLLTKEYYIPIPLFHYRYSTSVPHKEKYGIK